MARSAIKNQNTIKEWDYIGNTTGSERISISNSLYKEIFCMVYLENNANITFSFHEPCDYTDERTYRQSYYENASSYRVAGIHSNQSGTWWGWVFFNSGSDVMSTTKLHWYAR